ncbi:uncharacterized protein Ecym_1172 [Eremothecium cymbalariae DBVPG|uniref:Uncharacterized protein n=1 Tax=Eremothecium cymbalariae (strain CBS 270.75 / DBVPG 7215 / KCTC 17166 / NRRL Y-17582) TaxID=931890 RepID=G8JMV8_ERECY|nr:hypothetical protein Ecym_1172 [Eremothecium cymbalariae DBVPG\
MELRRSTRLKRANTDTSVSKYNASSEDDSFRLSPSRSPPTTVIQQSSLQQQQQFKTHNRNTKKLQVGGASNLINKVNFHDAVLAKFPRPKYHCKRTEPTFRFAGLSKIKVSELDRIIQDLTQSRNEQASKFDGSVANSSHSHASHSGKNSNNSSTKEVITDSAGYELFTYPTDLVAIGNIIQQISQLKDELAVTTDDYDPEKLIADIKKHGTHSLNDIDRQLVRLAEENHSAPDEGWLNALADIHDINLQDISDMIVTRNMKKTGMMNTGLGNVHSSRKADIQFLSNKWNKLLAKERNITLYWPNKNSNKKTYCSMSSNNLLSQSNVISPDASGNAVNTVSKLNEPLNTAVQENPRDKFKDVPLLF